MKYLNYIFFMAMIFAATAFYFMWLPLPHYSICRILSKTDLKDGWHKFRCIGESDMTNDKDSLINAFDLYSKNIYQAGHYVITYPNDSIKW